MDSLLQQSHSGLHVHLRSSSPVHLQAQFDAAPGELVALVGASGSGKTTLLRSIAGLHRSADLAGQVHLGGEFWMDSKQGIHASPQQRRVGLVFQQYALFPHLTAIDNIALCARPIRASGQNDSKKTAQSWLDRMGMSELAQRLPHELSGGQQQRVALARALVRIGDGGGDGGSGGSSGAGGVLLLDEPFSAVDAPMRQVLYRELAQLRQSVNIPIVLVTHDLHEARRLADKIVIIDAGQSLQSGSPAHVMRSPRNARVAQLVGIHNHFSARFFSDVPGQAALQWGELRLRVIDKNKIANDTAVTWVLAGEEVQLHATDASMDAAVNRLECRLSEMLPLGEISPCRLAVQGTQDTIQLNLPTAQLSAMRVASGDAVALAVPPESVHIMPLKI
jgi:molybdate transport system ATP-binding protein